MKGMMAFTVVIRLIAMIPPTQAVEMCTRLGRLTGVVEGKMLPDSQTTNLTMPGIMTCAKACFNRRRCKSFNFNMKTSECQLNRRTKDSLQLIENEYFVFSDIIHFPEILAGACAHHNCPINSYCQPIDDSQPERRPEVCLESPTVENGHFGEVPSESPIAATLSYICDQRYLPQAKVICQDNGTWSSPVCLRVTSCSMVKQYQPDSEDGEYWLRLPNFDYYKTQVYCHNISTRSPTEFLTLPNINYGIYPRFRDADCDGVPEKLDGVYADQGGEVWFKPFTKISHSSNYMNYGMAYDCYTYRDGCECKWNFTIDLRGTGWRVGTDQELELMGHKPKLNIDRKMNGTLIILRCNDGCKPENGLFLTPFSQNITNTTSK